MVTRKGTDPIENLETVRKCLARTAFPASKYDIFSEAVREGVDMNVITLIQSLPAREYSTPDEVLHALGFYRLGREEAYG